MKRPKLIRLLCFFLAAITPFTALAAVIVFTKPAYSETFLGELPYKVDRLDSVEGPKIIVIGGSSVAFGLDSTMLESLTGMPVVNFGLYADLGTKIMLDLAKKSIGKGDIAVIAPELDPQTLSLFFNGKSAWRACETRLSLLLRIGRGNAGDLLGSVPGFISEKNTQLRAGTPADGVYTRASFNEIGDMIYERPYNNMSVGYDISKPVSFSPDIFSGDFIDYVNDFAAYCEKKGAKAVWSFPPVNASGIEAGTDEATYEALYARLCEELDFEIISNPGDYVMPSRYFYDTNFHPNSAGAKHHTSHLASDLRRYLGLTDIVAAELPEPEEKPVTDELSESEWSRFFIFEDIKDNEGTVIGLAVCGLTDEGKTLPSVEVPAAHNGLRVIQVKAGTFSGSELLGSVTLRKNVESMENGAFAGCLSLRYVHIYKESEIIIDQTLLTTGAPDDMKFVLPTQDIYNVYSTGYFWANYCARMTVGE